MPDILFEGESTGFGEVILGPPTIVKTPDYPKSFGPQIQMEWR